MAAVLVWQLPNLASVTGERAMLPVDGVSVLCALMLIAAALLTTVLHRQRMMAIFAICAALSLIVAEIGWRVAPTANFFLPFSRGWELLAGSMCALWLQDRSPGTGARSNLLSGIGLALILVPIVAFDKFTPSPSLWIGAPVLGQQVVAAVRFAPGSAS